MSFRAINNCAICAKVMLVAMIASTGALLLAAAGFTINDFFTMREQAFSGASVRAEWLAQCSARALEFNDVEHVEEILQALGTDRRVNFAIVYDRDGKAFASYSRSGETNSLPAPPVLDAQEFADNAVTTTRRIMAKGSQVGTVFLRFELAPRAARIQRHAVITLIVLLASSVAAFFLSAWLQRLISGPLLALSKTTRAIATEENFSLRAPKLADDEVGQVVDNFNNMLAQIQARDIALRVAQDELELRVQNRTRELQKEVSERRRAEDALRESQSLYSSLVEHLPLAIYRKDAAGKVTFANKFFWKVLRCQPDDLNGNDHTPAHLAAKYFADHNRVMSEGVTIETEEEVQTRAGELLQVQALKVPVYGSDGAIKGTQGCFLDITDRKRMEEALALERDLLRTLLDSSPDYIYFKDRQCRFLRCSRAFIRRLGFSDHDEAVGKSDFDFFHEDAGREYFEDEQNIMRTGKSIIGKVEREVWADGSISWVLTSKMPYRDNSGEIIGTFGISKDITALKKAEAELGETHKQLLEASRRAGMAEVATGVLHNVGNVLNSVNVATTVVADLVRRSKISSVHKLANWMRNGTDDTAVSKTEQLRDYLEKLSQRLGQEQSTLLDELNLLSSHLEHMKEIVAMQQTYAKVSGISEPLPASSLVEDALCMNSAALARHDVHVRREFEEVPRIFVDRHKVLQILINLISNAKYAVDGAAQIHKEMKVRINREGEMAAIAIIDNGIGIAPENLTQIFQHGFTTRKSGHGFGLHSSAIAARELGGSLRVHSDGIGCGATFVLTLPIETFTTKTSLTS